MLTVDCYVCGKELEPMEMFSVQDGSGRFFPACDSCMRCLPDMGRAYMYLIDQISKAANPIKSNKVEIGLNVIVKSERIATSNLRPKNRPKISK